MTNATTRQPDRPTMPRNPAAALACPQPLNPHCTCPGCQACTDTHPTMTAQVIRGRFTGSLSASGF